MGIPSEKGNTICHKFPMLYFGTWCLSIDCLFCMIVCNSFILIRHFIQFGNLQGSRFIESGSPTLPDSMLLYLLNRLQLDATGIFDIRVFIMWRNKTWISTEHFAGHSEKRMFNLTRDWLQMNLKYNHDKNNTHYGKESISFQTNLFIQYQKCTLSQIKGILNVGWPRI